MRGNSQAFPYLRDRLRYKRQTDHDKRNTAPAKSRDKLAEKDPAAERHQDIDHPRKRKSDGEWNISKHIKPADEAGDDEKNRPPHQRRSQTQQQEIPPLRSE